MPEPSERPQLANADRLLTPQEVADRLQITVRQLQRRGCPFICLGGRTRRYIWRAVEEWLREQERRPTRRAAAP